MERSALQWVSILSRLKSLFLEFPTALPVWPPGLDLDNSNQTPGGLIHSMQLLTGAPITRWCRCVGGKKHAKNIKLLLTTIRTRNFLGIWIKSLLNYFPDTNQLCSTSGWIHSILLYMHFDITSVLTQTMARRNINIRVLKTIQQLTTGVFKANLHICSPSCPFNLFFWVNYSPCVHDDQTGLLFGFTKLMKWIADVSITLTVWEPGYFSPSRTADSTGSQLHDGIK